LRTPVFVFASNFFVFESDLVNDISIVLRKPSRTRKVVKELSENKLGDLPPDFGRHVVGKNAGMLAAFQGFHTLHGGKKIRQNCKLFFDSS